MSDNTKTLAALLIGAAAGAVLGVLFAPDRGDKTRSKLLDYARTKGEELGEYVDEGVSYAKSKVETGKDKVSKLATEIREKGNEYASKAEDLKDKAKSEFDDAKSRTKQQYS